MTPKLKAIELLEKFIYRTKDYVEIEDAKACAIIAIDEIMKTYPSKNGIALYENQINDFKYWHQVKIEIEML
jgi:hypothetical protein